MTAAPAVITAPKCPRCGGWQVRVFGWVLRGAVRQDVFACEACQHTWETPAP